MENAIFRQRLRELRERQHKSAVVVSELCGLHPDMYRRYELGEALPSYNNLILIAEYYNCPIDYLTGRSNQRWKSD